jgi:hypothetical protein
MASTSAADYPALGFDPAPGDVEAVEEAASTLRAVRRTLEDVAALLDGAPIDGWHGAVATAFDDLFRLELRPVVETAGTALDDSRRALDGWATDLRDYQRRARDLEVEAARAQQQAAAAASALDDVPEADDASDSASAERRAIAQRISRADEALVQGRSDAQALLTEYTDAGAAVGRLLETAQAAAPVDLRRLTGLSGVAAIVVGSMTGPERDQYLRDHPEVGALLLELQLRSEGLLDGPIESDAYRTWLENAARRGVPAETILDIVRTHGIGPDDFAVLDGLEEVKDRDGKSFFMLPDDISDDDARKAVLMTYILNAGTDYGSASTDNDFDETPYSADEVQRIIDRQKRNDWSYKDDVDFVHDNGGRLVTTPNGMLMGLGGNWVQDLYSQKGGTTWGDIFMLNIDDVDDPAAVLRETVEGGQTRFQDDDGSIDEGSLDLDRLLHHEERHSQQWAEKGHSGFLRSYVWEQIRRRNDTEEDAGLKDGGY